MEMFERRSKHRQDTRLRSKVSKDREAGRTPPKRKRRVAGYQLKRRRRTQTSSRHAEATCSSNRTSSEFPCNLKFGMNAVVVVRRKCRIGRLRGH